MKVNEWQRLQDPRESQYRSLTFNVLLKSKSCGTKWKRSATVKYHFKSYPLSAVTLFISPVLHIPVKAIVLTSLLPSPDPSAVCLASVSGSSVPTHYHRSLALPLGLVGTLVSVKSNPGNKAAFPEASRAPVLIRLNIPLSAQPEFPFEPQRWGRYRQVK